MLIKIIPFDPTWEAAYEEEARRIKNILKDILVDIHHIGSTAVKDLPAKPIIDIMPVVTHILLVDPFNDEFQALGYQCMGEFGIEGRRYFRKGCEQRTHHVHIFEEKNHKDIDRHLVFRDYLRAHPHIAAKYGDLKKKLAAQFPEDIQAYCDGKDVFVKQTEKEALLWYQKFNK